jgi:hypothetical protein
VLPVTAEPDQALSRVTAWLNRAYQCITDESGKRRLNVDALDGRLVSELPESYHAARKEIDEEFRGVLLELHDHVIPDVESVLPDSAEAFEELEECLFVLRTAIFRPGSEFDARGRAHELLTWAAKRQIRILDINHARSRAAEVACPACDKPHEDSESLRLHFEAEHRPPDYRAEIVEAVGKCRAAWREADQAVRREAVPASPQEASPESSTADPSTTADVFRKEGKGWSMSFNGESGRFRHLKGFENIALILEHRETGVSAVTLASDVDTALGDNSPARDYEDGLSVVGTALPMRERVPPELWDEGLRGMEENAEEAEARGEPKEAAEIRDRIKLLEKERAKDYGLEGRERDESSLVQKARQTVKTRLSRARKSIGVTMPHLAEHFEQSIRCKGGTYSYCPEPPREWLVR